MVDGVVLPQKDTARAREQVAEPRRQRLSDSYGVDELRGPLTWQRRVGFFLHLPFSYFMIFLFRFVGRYRIPRMKEIRAEFQEMIKKAEGVPLMMCGNHLTYIDSALVMWALATMPWYQRNYRYLSWNLPAGDYFRKRFSYRLVAYLAKCIFIHRDGTKSHQTAIVNMARELLKEGEMVAVFPEGKRSRKGRFNAEQLTYGVGKMISKMDRCKVLCFYLRSHKQGNTHRGYPPRGSQFYLDLKLIEPRTTQEGRGAYREVVDQISSTIQSMEKEYFSQHQ